MLSSRQTGVTQERGLLYLLVGIWRWGKDTRRLDQIDCMMDIFFPGCVIPLRCSLRRERYWNGSFEEDLYMVRD